MLKKKITFTDYDGNQRTEEFLFSLNKAELMEMNLSTTGGLERYIERISSELDGAKIVDMFKTLILKSYGKKSDDGFSFVKDPVATKRFEQSEAYSELFMELATNSQAAAAFFNGIIPQTGGIPEIAAENK